MNKDITIGIVGGYGDTGVIIAGELIKDPACRLLIGGRNNDKINQLVKKLGERASGKKVDVNNDKEIEEFCKACSIIINCTGPSWIVGDKVVKYALKAGCDYIDLGIWYDKNNQYKQQFEERGLTGLIYAGWVPGITGILPRHLYNEAKKSLDSIDSLHTYIGDRSGWSSSALYDVMHHFIRGVEPGIFKNGKWSGTLAPLALFISRYYKFPGPFGRFIVGPVYNIEQKNLAQETKLPKMGSYIGCVGLSGMVRLFIVRYSPISDEKALPLLKKAVQHEYEKQGTAGVVSCELTGRKNGKKVQLNAAIFDKDTVHITGICTTLATRMIIEKKVKRKGLHFLCDVVEPSLFLKRLDEYGIKVQGNIGYNY